MVTDRPHRLAGWEWWNHFGPFFFFSLHSLLVFSFHFLLIRTSLHFIHTFCVKVVNWKDFEQTRVGGGFIGG